MTQKIKIIIVDDHPLIKEGLKQILSFYPDIEIVSEGSNGSEAISIVSETSCDILLLDINMPVMSGLDALKIIRQTNPYLKVLLLTVENDFGTLREAIDLKVNGYILKESAGSTLTDAIRHVYSGGNYIDQTLTKHVFNIINEPSVAKESTSKPEMPDPFSLLTEREKEILSYISKGCSNKEIASKLFLSEKTIRNTITSIFKKINVKDRVQAAIYVLNCTS
ncbi:MAG: response regulator transcription factor [Proteocatella sp.]|jgi:two-component system response regulator DegU|nr:response regulator transcription factor [Proteocatella sp.]MBP8654785.1 response regulator transcription factor [Proteocatella sp.]MBP9659370.1 response regulator transcription factor [Proteocatella sp.]MBP9967297.1 response regulator transcription factor [Proteocatella sp.]